jgi:hypothetical protein
MMTMLDVPVGFLCFLMFVAVALAGLTFEYF